MKNILEQEILMALGCTEPIAVALCAATAYNIIGGEKIKSVICLANSNIIKNATSVYIPNTGGLYGMKSAVAAGIISNEPELKMELLKNLNSEKIKKIKFLLENEIIEVLPYKTDKSIHIDVIVKTENGVGQCIIENSHSNITLIRKNDEIIYSKEKIEEERENSLDYSILNLESIYNYINTVHISELDIIKKSIEVNKKICNEGLKGNYGLSVAKDLEKNSFSEFFNSNALNNAIKNTVAGTDARMAGCNLPAMSNSGSGNQGIATTMPVVAYGESKNICEEKLIRGAALSNLVTIYIKTNLGRLSSLCGAVNASAGSSCGIVYLNDGTVEQMEKSINNVIGNIAGMFCDGAKAGCGLKIATGTFVSVLSAHRALEGSGINSTDGIVGKNIDETLENYGRISKYGLKELDNILLDIMVKK